MKKLIKYNSFLVVSLLPLIFILVKLKEYCINMPYADQWAFVPWFMKIDHGNFGFGDLWAQYNEHRILFPKIVGLTLAHLTHWYTPAEIGWSVLVAIIGLSLLLLMLRKTYDSKRPIQLTVAALLISSWFFSPIQWQNWMWGWQMEWFMCITAAITTIYFLDKFTATQKNKYFWWAIVVASIGTYSLASGMFMWLIGLAMLTCYLWLKKVQKKKLPIWAAFGVVEIILYYYHYHKPPDSPPPSLALHHFGDFLQFFFMTLGRPVTGQSDAAYLFGLMTTALIVSSLVVVYIRRQAIVSWPSFIRWYALIAYSLIALLATSVGRLGLGVPGAMASRYTAFSLLIIIGLIGVIVALVNEPKIKNATAQMTLIIICIVCAPLLMQSYRIGMFEMRQQSQLLHDIKLCTDIPYPTDHCLRATFPPSAAAVRVWLDYVKHKNYAGY